MKSYRRHSLIFVITFSLLGLISFGHTAPRAFTKGAWAYTFTLLPQAGTTFTVNSTADPGTGSCDAVECTLREAMTAANALAGPDTIAFNIPGAGPHTIRPTSPLPTITSPVSIDGYTQPGASPNTLVADDNAMLMIELDGTLAAGVLVMININAGSSVVRGLVINRIPRAISMDTNGGNIIEGNFLGTNIAGTAAALSNDYGVMVSTGSFNNTIGGLTPASRNLISGNNSGVALFGGPGNLVQGNFIGTDRTGNNDLGNNVGINVIASNGNTIGGTSPGARNIISGNSTGISMQGGTNTIQGNYIGVSATGGAFNYSGVSTSGVSIFNATGCTVGGLTPEARNVISGNSIGIALNNAPSTIMQGNFIGTDATGTARLGNSLLGINITLSGNSVIGGTAAGAGNLISANGSGIQITPNTTGLVIQIQGNLIGTDASGTADLGNAGDGISLTDSGNRSATITIGGTDPGARNVISGNDGDGIDIRAVSGTVIQGNYIGTQIDGVSALGNNRHGINIVQTSGTTVGGTSTGAGNRIAFNGAGLEFGGGVIIDGTGSINNPVRGNSIFSNAGNGLNPSGGLGIDLSVNGGGNGATLNDGCDGDAGPNNLQNFPVLTSATTTGGTTTILGTLNSTASTSFNIDFYSSPSCDSTGYGEGRTFLGSTTVTTDGSCSASFSATLPVTLPSGQSVTATATDPLGNTSEFSQCIQVAGMNPPVATDDSFSTDEDAPLNVTAPGVLSNDTDPDAATTLTAQLAVGPAHGTLTLNQDGSFTYTPAANFNGTDTFTYRASDGSNTSNTGTVQLNVNPVNDPPVAADDGYSTAENMPLSVAAASGVLMNDTDTEGSTLSAILVRTPSHAESFSWNPNGSFIYTPANGFSGTDTFTYRSSDGAADSDIATVTLTVNEGGTLQFTQSDYTVNENAGAATITITRAGGTSGMATVLISTSDGTAGAADYTAVSQTVSFADGETSKTIDVPITDDAFDEANETVNLTLLNPKGSAALGNPQAATLTILDDDAAPTPTPTPTPTAIPTPASTPTPTPTPTPVPSPSPTPVPTPAVIEFEQPAFTIDEAGCVAASITVTRTGDTSLSATVDYLTSDQSGMTPCQTNNTGLASVRCDYNTAAGTLRFAPGEQTKKIPLIAIDDAYVEGAETFQLRLTNPQGASLGAGDSATITIADNDAQAATQNPIDSLPFFLCMQYVDFLGRVHEDAGFQFWMQRMTGQCPQGEACDPVDTALRFFGSDEFRERGYFVYLFYHAALGRRPGYGEWILDVSQLNGFKTAAEQEAARDEFIKEFMSRQEFANLYDGAQTGDAFVEALIQRSGVTPASRQALAGNYATVGRPQTLRAFIETPEVQARFVDQAFVTMLYFGFLRREPEAGGFDFWIQKLKETNHDYRFLVGGFLQSDEYRFRFALIPAR